MLSHVVEICCLGADKLKKLGPFPLNTGMFEVLTEQNAAVLKHTNVQTVQNVLLLHTNAVY